jgi:hypothetical protein
VLRCQRKFHFKFSILSYNNNQPAKQPSTSQIFYITCVHSSISSVFLCTRCLCWFIYLLCLFVCVCICYMFALVYVLWVFVWLSVRLVFIHLYILCRFVCPSLCFVNFVHSPISFVCMFVCLLVFVTFVHSSISSVCLYVCPSGVCFLNCVVSIWARMCQAANDCISLRKFDQQWVCEQKYFRNTIVFSFLILAKNI